MILWSGPPKIAFDLIVETETIDQITRGTLNNSLNHTTGFSPISSITHQAQIFASALAWPNLKELHLVSLAGPQTEWTAKVNVVAGRPIASVYDAARGMFSFVGFEDEEHHCHSGADFLYIGYTCDDFPMFAFAYLDMPFLIGWLFFPDGRKKQPIKYRFPDHLFDAKLEIQLYSYSGFSQAEQQRCWERVKQIYKERH